MNCRRTSRSSGTKRRTTGPTRGRMGPQAGVATAASSSERARSVPLKSRRMTTQMRTRATSRLRSGCTGSASGTQSSRARPRCARRSTLLPRMLAGTKRAEPSSTSCACALRHCLRCPASRGVSSELHVQGGVAACRAALLSARGGRMQAIGGLVCEDCGTSVCSAGFQVLWRGRRGWGDEELPSPLCRPCGAHWTKHAAVRSQAAMERSAAQSRREHLFPRHSSWGNMDLLKARPPPPPRPCSCQRTRRRAHPPRLRLRPRRAPRAGIAGAAQLAVPAGARAAAPHAHAPAPRGARPARPAPDHLAQPAHAVRGRV